MPFRTFSDHEVLTASLVNKYWIQQHHVIKTADETVTSSITPQPDNELVVPLLANTDYWVECMIIYDGIQAADILVGWTYPASTAIDWTYGGLHIGATVGSDRVSRSSRTETQTGDAGCPNAATGTSNAILPIEGIVRTSGTAGSLTLTWAQRATNATGTIVRAGSLMILQRLTV